MLQGGYVSQSSGSKQLTVTKKANVLDKGSRTKATAASNNNGNGSDNSGGGGGGGGTGVSVSSLHRVSKENLYLITFTYRYKN